MPSEPAPAAATRKFGRNFSLLSKSSKDQTSDSRWKFSKGTGPVAELTDSQQDGKKQQKTAAQLDKRQSKMNVFELFSKPKVERARGFHEPGAESPPERSKTPTHLYRPPDAHTSDCSPTKHQIGVQRDAPKRLTRASDPWEAPPLFQAYPQAVKLGHLHTINVSTETLIRLQHLVSSGPGTTLAAVGEEEEPQRQTSRLAPKRFSTAADSLELVEKIFVLVTEGRIVQYAGRGSSSRMPEKILQLGPKSVAFACDLIPGKHWVIQVVQAANEDGAPAIKQSRSLLSKLRDPSGRKNSTSFVMILDSAEEMDSWLKTIRAMIQRSSGMRVHSDPEPWENEGAADDSRRLTKIPSHRYLVQKPPHQGQQHADYRASLKSTTSSTLTSPLDAPGSQGPVPKNFSRRSSPRDPPRLGPFEREVNAARSMRAPLTPETSSVATTNVSTDQLRLEQLREGSRYSFLSTRTSRTSETETIATSRCSSSPPSPHMETFVEPDLRHSPLPPLPTSSNRSPDSSMHRRSLVSSSNGIEPTRGSSAQHFPPNPRFSTVFDNVERPAPLRIRHPATKSTPSASQPRARTHVAPPPVLPVEAPAAQFGDGSRTRTPMRRDSDKADLQERQMEMSVHRRDILHRAIEQQEHQATRSPERPNQTPQTQSRAKPFFRPLPVKPSETYAGQAQVLTFHRPSEPVVPRRLSSLGSPVSPNFSHRTTTAQPASRKPSLTFSPTPAATPNFSTSGAVPATAPPPLTLRRPNSMLIRSDPAPFLSNSRQRGGSRSSSAAPLGTRTSEGYREAAAQQTVAEMPSRQTGHPNVPVEAGRPMLRARASVQAMPLQSLPPPMPPPNAPLPATPPVPNVA